ncbi:MAG: cytochrome c-type biogenesis protein CcmH/NrfG [Pseudohongiellaceae bacterium]|jgi:cytochrome c-type biogenesis protein CcmH/NrfG
MSAEHDSFRPGAPPGGGRWTWLGVLGLLVLVAATFEAVPSFGFVTFDDPGYVLKNDMVQKGLTGAGLRWAFTETHMANWHPLTWLSHMADVQLFGGAADQAGGHHLTSVMLHGLGAVLLFLALGRLTGRRGCAFVVAALFAVHPLRAESVAWVSERKDVLSGLFFMATLLAWEAYGRGPTRRRFWLVFVALTLGLLSKPMLVTLPCVLLLLDAWPLGRWRGGPLPSVTSGGAAPCRTGSLFKEKLPLFAVVGAVVAATMFAQNKGGAVVDLGVLPFTERLARGSVALWSYVGKVLWPTDMVFHYPLAPGGTPLASAWLGALALLIVTLAVLVGPGRRHPYLALGWLWFVGMLMPVIGLVAVGSQAMADRYTYLPSLGLTVALVFAAADVLRWCSLPRWLAPSLSALVIAVTAAAGHEQVAVWRSSFRLYTHATSIDGGSSLAHLNLALVLSKRGDEDEAEQHFLEALEKGPSFGRNHSAYADLLAGQERWEEAAQHFQSSLELTPSDFVTLMGFAELRVSQERWTEGAALAERACALRPRSPQARSLLGSAFLGGGEFGPAVEAFKLLVEGSPDDAQARAQLALARQRRRESR